MNELITIKVTRASDIFAQLWLRVLKVPGFKTYRRAPVRVQVQPEDLPIISCYLLDDDGNAEGEPQSGTPKMTQMVKLGISGIVIDSSGDEQYLQLVAAVDALDDLLLRDPEFISYDLMRGVHRRRVRWETNQVGETPLSEFQYELDVSVTNLWEPTFVDDLRTVDVIGGPGLNREIHARHNLRTLAKFTGKGALKVG